MDFRNGILNKVILPILIFIALLTFLHNKIWAFIWAAFVILVNIWLKRSSIYTALGTSAQAKGAFDKAGQYYQKAIHAAPFDTKPVLTYGYMLLRMGQPGRAEELFDFITSSTFPSGAQQMAKANLALVYWKTDRISKGIDILTELHDTGYKTTVTLGTLPYLFMVAGRMDEALARAEEAYAYNSSDSVIIENLARISHLSGDMDKAASLYAVLEKKSPAYPEAWYNIGLFYRDAGDPAKAREAFQRASACIFTYLSAITREDVTKELENPDTL